MKLILVSACNPGYLWRASIYWLTIQEWSKADENRYYACGGNLPTNGGIIDFRYLDPNKFLAPNPKCSIQHGEFLAQDSFDPNDLVIWTDSDMRMQRWFTDEELGVIHSVRQNDLMLLKNSHKDLGYEFESLTPDISWDTFLLLLGESPSISNYRCFNTGVIIARAATYARLFRLYCALELELAPRFAHPASQQWILSYLANKCFNVLPLSPRIHLFEHDYIRTDSNRTSVHDGIVYVDDAPAVFWHCK